MRLSWPTFDKAPRPYVAFAAIDRSHAQRLYRAQNVVWIWLGIAAILSTVAYFERPHLGPVLVTDSHAVDLLRVLLFAVGGFGISSGIWWIRRIVEVWGHLCFSSGAIITAAAEISLGLDPLSIALVSGLAVASALRVWYIVAWIGAGRVGAAVEHASSRE